jgi:predicted Zn-dependent protease
VWAFGASALVGLGGLYAVYETGDHGGDVTYVYAGGVGIRSGDTADVGRLLLAGLYHQAMLDRREKRPAAAAELIEQMARRWPDDLTIRFMAAESRLVDRHDAPGALAALAAIQVAPDDSRSRLRRDFLLADAFVAAGQEDSARAVLQGLASDFPDNPRIKDRLDRLDRP